jgi:hypothetical protein
LPDGGFAIPVDRGIDILQLRWALDGSNQGGDIAAFPTQTHE